MSYYNGWKPGLPDRLREWRGRRVELLVDVETRGGEAFHAGEVLTVTSTYRGGLCLEDPATMTRGQGFTATRLIRRVGVRAVRLLPEE